MFKPKPGIFCRYVYSQNTECLNNSQSSIQCKISGKSVEKLCLPDLVNIQKTMELHHAINR